MDWKWNEYHAKAEREILFLQFQMRDACSDIANLQTLMQTISGDYRVGRLHPNWTPARIEKLERDVAALHNAINALTLRVATLEAAAQSQPPVATLTEARVLELIALERRAAPQPSVDPVKTKSRTRKQP